MNANKDAKPESPASLLGWRHRMPPGPWSTVLVILPFSVAAFLGIAFAVLMPWLLWLREFIRAM